MKAQLLSKKGIRGFKVAASGEHGLRPNQSMLILGLWSVKSQGKIPRRPEPGLLMLRGELVEALATEDTWGAQEPAQGPSVYRESRWTEQDGNQCPRYTEWWEEQGQQG